MRVARGLAKLGIRPNAISVSSVVFATLGGLCFGFCTGFHDWRKPALLAGAALCMQLRLLCNLFDGMVAVEYGLTTKSGEIFNDLPDRLSDSAILLGAGYAVRQLPFGVDLGWAAALLAMLTAYVRLLGATAGAKQCFLGPMAKQHRVALMTLGAVAAAIFRTQVEWILAGTLGVITVGCVLTILRRLLVIVRRLEGCGTEN
jgi:phosphatidylglycerophosphate synthase